MTAQTSYPTADQYLTALDRLGLRVQHRAGKWQAQCPAHDDHVASLSLRDDGAPHCFAGCTTEDIKRALGLWADTLRPLAAVAPLGPLVAEYAYQHADGTAAHWTVRYAPKDFRQYTLTATGRKSWTLKGTALVLYHLPAVATAIRTGAPVYYVEGEKDADLLTTWGLAATTNPMGAGKWQPQYADMLRGADLVLIPDRDAPGLDHMARVLALAGAGLRRARVLVLPAGKDVSEWAAQGGTAADFARLVDALPDTPLPDATALRTDDYTDTGNGRRFAAAETGRLLWSEPDGAFFTWADTHWQRDNLRVVEIRADQVLDQLEVEAAQLPDSPLAKKARAWAVQARQAPRRKALVDLARHLPGIACDPAHLDAQPWLWAAPNGTLDLRTGRLREADPRDYLTRRSAALHLPRADAPRWADFLETVLPDTATRTYVQRAAGYSLTGSVREQCIFFLHGRGANGKSVFLNVLRTLWGDYAGMAPASLLAPDDGNKHPADRMQLRGRRFVVATETEEGRRLNESLLKQITSDEPIKARDYYGSFVEFVPTHKLWIGGNHKPQIRGTDDGIWRRIHLIPFTVQIPEAQRNPNLTAELLADEGPGILHWALLGLSDWLHGSGGLCPPEAVLAATRDYRATEDPLGQFLAARCTLDEAFFCKLGALHDAYIQWAAQNGQPDLARKTVANRLRERGGLQVRVSHGTTSVYGVTLRPPDPEDG